jgi:hypothetical protein
MAEGGGRIWRSGDELGCSPTARERRSGAGRPGREVRGERRLASDGKRGRDCEGAGGASCVVTGRQWSRSPSRHSQSGC